MYMTMSYWKTGRMSNGRMIPIGEDCYPYADAGLLIIADGLGGRGGYPHRKIKPEILQRELFYDIFSNGVFGETDDEFKQFVLESFSELFELKDCYFTDTTTMRTSGYFASRITTAVVLHEFKYNPDFAKETVFGKLASATEEERKEYLRAAGDKLAEILKSKNAAIAANLGLELESKIGGTYLLPSTVVVAFADEHDEDVDVLYLWAGDSRGYVWDDKGLAQITDDHEKNEVMTNLVSVTKPFRVEAGFRRFAKPVVLFNATDGCYKCPVFASPLDLECIFVNALTESDDLVGVERILREQFKVLGVHDDSNTMALATFGFADYAALKVAANARKDEIGKTIVDKLPGILERDYQGELEKLDARRNAVLEPLRDELFALPAVREYVKAHSEECRCDAYDAETAELRKEEARVTETIESERAGILKWVKTNWPKPFLRGGEGDDGSKIDPKQYEVYKKKEGKLSAAKAEYDKSGEKALGCLRTSYGELETMRDDLGTSSAALCCDETDKILKCIEDMKDALTKLSKSLKKLTRMRKTERELLDISARWIDEDIEVISRFAEKLLSGASSLDREKVPVAQYEELESHLETYNKAVRRKEEIAAARSEAADKYLESIWTENLAVLLDGIMSEKTKIRLTDEQEKLAAAAEDFARKREELKGCLELRARLYAEYDVSYRRYFEESAL